MTYKSLFSVLSDPGQAKAVVDQGAQLATQFQAHYDLLCLGVDRTQSGFYYAGASAVVIQDAMDQAHAKAAKIREGVQNHLPGPGVVFSLDDGVAHVADVSRHVAPRARYADLVILPQPFGPNRGIEAEYILEAALFNGRAPVLVLPDAARPIATPKQITIAWNESAEALNAVRRALPFLTQADLVRVLVIDPPTHGMHRSDPGGLLSQMLARHGVKTEVDVVAKTLPRVSDILLRHAQDKATDMIVMGGYGHSRFREAVLGGATRDMLTQTEVPVFMAH